MASTLPKVVLTGGGTGGHVTPLIALSQSLIDHAELSVIIEHGDEHSRRALDSLPVSLHEVKAGKLRRYHGKTGWYFFHPINIWEDIRDSGRLAYGFTSSLRLLRKLRPDVVFAKGGYVALPVGLAAASLGIPIITHDSDVVPGLTNRVLSKWAQIIAVGFPREHYTRYPARKLVQVGVPVRQEFKHLKHHPHKGVPTVLITGGSSGSHTLNQLVLSLGKQLMDQAKVVHLSGRNEYEDLDRLTKAWQATGRYHLLDYAGKELFELVASADIVITRAGATSITEYAVSGVPMIVVPSPFVTGGHQLKNAQVLEQASAAIVLGEPQLKDKPEMLITAVDDLLSNPQKRQWLVRNARAMMPADATEHLARLILKTARSRHH